MQYRPRYLVLAAIALALASSNTTARASGSCEALAEWARPYTDRSPTLAELTAFDASRQRAIFSVLAPAARVSLWREHLSALAQRPEFTTEQRMAVTELLDVVVPDAYTKGSSAQERARLAWKEREQLFPNRAQRRAFLVLGAAPTTPAAAATLDWCDCSPSYGQVECYPLVCGPPAGCFRQDGCGWIGLDECTMRCF